MVGKDFRESESWYGMTYTRKTLAENIMLGHVALKSRAVTVGYWHYCRASVWKGTWVLVYLDASWSVSRLCMTKRESIGTWDACLSINSDVIVALDFTHQRHIEDELAQRRWGGYFIAEQNLINRYNPHGVTLHISGWYQADTRHTLIGWIAPRAYQNMG